MKLNTTSQHAIRIMTYIVKYSENKFHHAKVISEKLSIPYKYLTRVMTQLVNANILTSTRGREGGYSLTKEANQIKVLDILEAVKESIGDKDCVLGTGLCNENKKCVLHDNWKDPKKAMLNMFKNTTLADINKDEYTI